MTKFKDIMFASLTEEEIRSLPQEWRAAWLMRPSNEKIEQAKSAMQFRALFIIVAAIYIYFTSHIEDLARYLIWVVVAYEFAYYSVRKEQCGQAYILATIKYMDKADELDKK